MEQVDPRNNNKDRKFFLNKLNWDTSPVNRDKTDESEGLLVEYWDFRRAPLLCLI